MLGAAKNRQRTAAPERADDLAGIELLDLDGNPRRLGDYWRDRPGVFVFLRHYGWVFCRKHAMQLHRDRDKFDRAGANLVVIGQGTPEQGAHFLESQHVDLPLLIDRERRSYKAAGTKIATLTELVGPRVVLKGALSGQRQGKTVGHNAQLGGVLVIATDGEVVWAHMSEDASDIPSNDEVLEAVARAG